MLPAMLRHARKRGRRHGNLAWVRATAQALPFADESFDVVSCRGALHNFPDLDGALAEIARVLRPGGRFTVATYRAGGPASFERVRRRIRAAAFTEAGLAGAFAQAGLEGFRCLHTGPAWLLAVATRSP